MYSGILYTYIGKFFFPFEFYSITEILPVINGKPIISSIY